MEERPKKVVYEISTGSVLKVVLVLLGLWVLFLIRDVLVIILVVLIISIALEPIVTRLAKQGIPKGLSIIILYLALLIVIGLAVYLIVPPVATQIRELTFNIPDKLSQFDFSNASSTISTLLDKLSSQLSSAGGTFLNAIFSIFGGVVSAVTVFALTYYFLVEEDGVRDTLVGWIPVQHKERLKSTIEKVSFKLSHWLRGQLTLMLIVGTLDGLALWALGIPFALTLGVLSGLIEVIPIVGPILAGATAVFVAFVSGVAFWKLLVIVAVYILVQQLENSVLVPKIMQKSIGMSPVIVIVALLIGMKLLGIGGAILAVPVAAGISVFVKEYWITKSSQ